jgi:glutamate--cysteine ligase
MDPSRSGLVPRIWNAAIPRYSDYAEWALDSGMFLFKRGERVFANTGQTFRSFLRDGYQGERATFADWKLHLNTLFPEVRLKNTLELRSCDSQKKPLMTALIALMTGLLYDDQALDEASSLVANLGFTQVEAERASLIRQGISGQFAGKPTREWAAALLQIASEGLGRRNRLSSNGKTETIFLEPLAALVREGLCPADRLIQGLQNDAPDALTLVERSRISA